MQPGAAEKKPIIQGWQMGLRLWLDTMPTGLLTVELAAPRHEIRRQPADPHRQAAHTPNHAGSTFCLVRHPLERPPGRLLQDYRPVRLPGERLPEQAGM